MHPRPDLRGGFMLLMLIAFTSIILGLATTFYFYCKRGLEDSSVAVTLANQRLAFAAALNYVTNRISSMPPPTLAPTLPINWSAPSTWTPNPFFLSTGDLNSVHLQVDGLSYSSRLGWFRVAYAFSNVDPIKTQLKNYFDALQTSNPLPSDLILTNCVIITTGVGPSQGKVMTQDPNDWQFEMRSWYLVECTATPMIAIKRCIPLATPPQTAEAPTGPIYW